MPTYLHKQLQKLSQATDFNGNLTVGIIENVATYWYVSSGHNVSQADATSLEGEAPAITGCYKQYEHAITNKTPQSTDPSQVRVITQLWVRPLCLLVNDLTV